MRSKTTFLKIALLALFAVSACLSTARAEELWLRVGANIPTSWNYACMVAMSEAMREVEPDIELVLQSTSGSTAHYSMFAAQELDIASGTSNTDYWANLGQAPLFDQVYEGEFYHLLPLTLAKTNVVVRQDSGINSMSDLNGKRVFVGDPGGASTTMSVDVLRMLGIKATEIQTDRTEGVEMMKEGRVDCVIFNVGTPYSVILELHSAVPVKLLPFTQEEIEACKAQAPYCIEATVTPNDGYEFVKETIPTVASLQTINVNAKLDDDIVYRLAKAIVTTWPEVVKVVPAAGAVDPAKDALRSAAKIHPGAIRYYEEIGLTVPAHLKP